MSEARVAAVSHIQLELDAVKAERDAARHQQSEADYASAAVSQAEQLLAATAETKELQLKTELESLRSEAMQAKTEFGEQVRTAEARISAGFEANLSDHRRLQTEYAELESASASAGATSGHAAALKADNDRLQRQLNEQSTMAGLARRRV